MGLLARKLDLGVLAQTVSGLAFGLSGYLVARAGFLSITSAVAWMPWVILGLTRRKPGLGNTIFLAVCIGMLLLAGHAQTAWYILLFAAAWSAFWTTQAQSQVHQQDPGRAEGGGFRAFAFKLVRWAIRAWGQLAIASLLGAMLAAVQLLPTAEYLMQSQRAEAVDYESAMTYSFWPWRILGLIAPGLFGSPASGDYWGYGNYWEDAIYIGLLPFLLAVGVILRQGRTSKNAGKRSNKEPGIRAIVAFLSVVILLSMLFALGDNLPLFPWLYRNVPTFDMFQSPARYTLWAVFALALLAGIGAQAWRSPAGRSLYWARLGTVAAAAVTLGAGLTALAAPRGLGQINPTAIRAFALAGLWGVGIGALAISLPERDSPPGGREGNGWWAWTVAGLVSADLIVAGWGLNPAVDLEVYRRDPPFGTPVHSLVGDGRIYLPREDEEQLKFQRFLRFDTFSPGESWDALRATLLPNTSMLAGIPSANNFDPLVPGRYARWMEALEDSGEMGRQRVLDQMAVTVVERVDPASPEGVRFETRQALPRIRWASCGMAAGTPEDALQAVAAVDAQLDRQVILEGEPGSLSTPCFPGEGETSASVEIRAENPNRLSVALQASEAGYLVIADVWYPGWTARVDGKPETILTANYIFRAVSIPAGDHRVELSYQPLPFYVGAMASTLAWVGIIFYIILRVRAGRPVYSRGSSLP
jgi:hypothetical protein